MEKIKLILKIFLIVAAASFAVHFSCKEKKLCEGVPIFDSYFSFKLVDKYGINLIAAWGARYLSDSVYLTKMDGSLPNQLGISGGGRIGFVIPDDDSEAKDSMVTREFLLYLPDNQGHPKDDVDTLKFQYLFNQSCYEKFRVWYNDSLYHDGQYIDFILLIKN